MDLRSGRQILSQMHDDISAVRTELTKFGVDLQDMNDEKAIELYQFLHETVVRNDGLNCAKVSQHIFSFVAPVPTTAKHHGHFNSTVQPFYNVTCCILTLRADLFFPSAPWIRLQRNGSANAFLTHGGRST